MFLVCTQEWFYHFKTNACLLLFKWQQVNKKASSDWKLTAAAAALFQKFRVKIYNMSIQKRFPNIKRNHLS
jgi:hypothetical protein